uniref:Transmembrane protein n=1 Tax=Anopheles culicifacies TaxID=139723 RepID=A0A182LV25_9DIPT
MMRSSVWFVLLVGVGLCFVVQASIHQHASASAPLSSSFMQLDVVRNLHPQHLKVLKRAAQAFERTIDQSKLEPAQKEAAKKMAVDQFAARLAEVKRSGHGH